MNNLHVYWRNNYLHIVAVVMVFTVAILLPPFSLFADRATSMLQAHLLLELFAVIVAILIATISWHDQKTSDNQSGLILAGFTIVAIMDLVHALSYEGMPNLVIQNTTHRAIFFWFAGRTFVVATLLLLVLRVRLPGSRLGWLAAALLACFLLFWLGTYGLDLIPLTFVPGQGVTTFKRNYEYFLCASDLVLMLLFILRATPRNQKQYFAFATSCLVMALGEVAFSNYKAPSDFLNIFGHAFKIVSYAFLYQSAFVTAIRQPYQQMRESEERFRSLTELSSDWYWEQDANSRFTMLSQGIGHSLFASYIGKARWELPVEGVTPEQWAQHKQLLAEHKPYKDFVYSSRNESGDMLTFSVSGFPFYDDQGHFLGYRGVGSNITDRIASEKKIELLAYHDALTGLPNRLLIQDRFEQAIAYANRASSRTALFYLDVDHFKHINDSLGHEAGDLLLKEIADRLISCMRDTDTISRQGGDEFLIVLPDLVDSDDAIPILAKFMQQFQNPYRINGNDVVTSASIGIAVYPDDGNDFETLRKKADMAMYQAKAAGRNTYRFFDKSMNDDVVEHLFIQNGLRTALERGEFVLHYQPQIDLASGRIIGVEALLRWQHPAQGLIPPGRFITIAEESGLIVPIGERVLHETCRQAVAWQQAGLPGLTMAVNLSAIQFRRGNIEQTVIQALQSSGLNPAQLELELTESIMLQNAESVLATVKRLKQQGVQLSIDDFGTGYSSLSYLKRFDIDKLKIDQSFVRDLASDPEDAAIVRAIIQMARSLNLKTIAEGVETAEILELLRSYGCEEVQGYYFARPMPAAEAEKFMLAHKPG